MRNFGKAAGILAARSQKDKQHIRDLEARIVALQELCAAAYQMAGCYHAPVVFLDNLSAAATGEPLPHAPGDGLPVVNQWLVIIDELREKLEKLGVYET